MIGSSLGADAIAHSSDRTSRRPVPRRESDPEPDIYVDRPLSGPERILRWKFDDRTPAPLAALSPGDRFTTRLTYRHGMVLAQSQAIVEDDEAEVAPAPEPIIKARYNQGRRNGGAARGRRAIAGAPPRAILIVEPCTLVRYEDEPTGPDGKPVTHEVKPSVLVAPGWWDVKCMECGQLLPHDEGRCGESEAQQ